MGQNQEKETNIKMKPGIQEEHINKTNFDFLNVIGRGGFGKVWKVFSKKDKKLYAMKQMSKLKICDKRSEKSIIRERKLLERMNHP